jgi:hypothetical protein
VNGRDVVVYYLLIVMAKVLTAILGHDGNVVMLAGDSLDVPDGIEEHDCDKLDLCFRRILEEKAASITLDLAYSGEQFGLEQLFVGGGMLVLCESVPDPCDHVSSCLEREDSRIQ